MSGLQTAFYIVSLVYMGVSLIIIFGILGALLVIRKKVVNLENMLKERLHTLTSMGEKASEVITTVKKLAGRKK